MQSISRIAEPQSSTARATTLALLGIGQQMEYFADRPLVAGIGQRQVRLYLVAVAAPVLLLHDVAGFGEVGDDDVGRAFRDVECGREIAQARVRVVRDVEQRARVVRKKAPL